MRSCGSGPAMRNVFMLYMPPGNPEAMVHYEDTIRKKVGHDRIFPHVDEGLRKKLQDTFGVRPIAVWGSRNSEKNRSVFDRMSEGDEVLIVEGGTIKLLGHIAGKIVSPGLSCELWKNLRGKRTEGWDLVYFIANPREVGLPFPAFCRLMGYNEAFRLRGLTMVAREKLDAFYAHYEDLYSILVAQKEGRPVEKIRETALPTGDRAIEPGGAVDEPTGALPGPPDEVSEHVRIQWTLLTLGKRAGEKVWAPRGDQSRITAAYKFLDFEPSLAAGLDTQTKYVENIDVVWKEEFRIDAAFEIENSTSVYSGLLRFADLTMVAPNSTYPLFIVAPGERRGRVREQLMRPAFKHLRLVEKVKFLSYDRVQEIADFFPDRSSGLTPEVISGKAEKLTA